ncbi:hypothetical protein BDZ97DRAFT_1851213 [Flammula alnicola]|nr:hypothetical protein BDZ97DRAFT_1851213 [Flammula alnicola]
MARKKRTNTRVESKPEVPENTNRELCVGQGSHRGAVLSVSHHHVPPAASELQHLTSNRPPDPAPGGFFQGSSNLDVNGGQYNQIYGHQTSVTINFDRELAALAERRERDSVMPQRSEPSSSFQASSNATSSRTPREETIVHTYRTVPIRDENNTSSRTLISVENSNKIYERHLGLKQRGFPLWIPEPNKRLPMPYRRKESTLFSEFKPGSYLASASIEKLHNDPSFPCYLTMPEGAIALDLENVPRFRAYAAANVENWYRYVNGPRGREAKNGEVRLVIGCDKTSTWGMAALTNLTQHKVNYLKFRTLEEARSDPSLPLYTWEYSGMAEVRVGPDVEEIEELKRNDQSDLAINGKYWNQCLFVRTLNLTLDNAAWQELNRDLESALIQESRQFRDRRDQNPPHNGSQNSGSETHGTDPSSGGNMGLRECPAPLAISNARRDRVTTSTSVTALKSHPADALNKMLLQKVPNSRVAITQDEDWCSVINEDDLIMPDFAQLTERVFAAHDICQEDGIVFLEPKKDQLDRPSRSNQVSVGNSSRGLIESSEAGSSGSIGAASGSRPSRRRSPSRATSPTSPFTSATEMHATIDRSTTVRTHGTSGADNPHARPDLLVEPGEIHSYPPRRATYFETHARRSRTTIILVKLMTIYPHTKWVWVLLAVTSLVVQAARTAEVSPHHELLMLYAETLITLAFDFEIGLRLLASLSDWRSFFQLGNNWLDLISAIGSSVIQIPVIRQSSLYSWLTMFQLARFYRVVLVVPRMKKLLVSMFGETYLQANITLFLVVINYIIAIFTLQILRGDISYDSEAGVRPGQTVVVVILVSAWLLGTNFIAYKLCIAGFNAGFNITKEQTMASQTPNLKQHKARRGSVKWLRRLNPAGWVKADPERPNISSLPSNLVLPTRKGHKIFVRKSFPKPNDLLSELFSALKERVRGTAKTQYLPLATPWNASTGTSNNLLEDPLDEELERDNTFLNRQVRLEEEGDDEDDVRRAENADFIVDHSSYDKVLWVLDQKSLPRRMCQKIVQPAGRDRIFGTPPSPVPYTIFQAILLLTVIGSIFVAGIATPAYRQHYFEQFGLIRGAWFEVAEVAFGYVLFVEFVIKVIADGFVFTPNGYLLSLWNCLDFIIMAGTIVNITTSLVFISGLGRFTRSLTALRALRLITLVGEIRNTLQTLIVHAVFSVIFNLTGGVVMLTLLIRQTPLNPPQIRPTGHVRGWCFDRAVHKRGWWLRATNALLALHILVLTLFLPRLHLIRLVDVFFSCFGLGWHRFRTNGWNIFDMLITSGGFITTLIVCSGHSSFGIQLFQKLFLSTVGLKLIQRTKSLNMLFKTVISCLPALSGFIGLWLVFSVFFAILLLEIFGLTTLHGNDIQTADYPSLWSMLSMLVFPSSSNSWNRYINNCDANSGGLSSPIDEVKLDCGSTAWTYVLFISWKLLSMYILVKTFTGVIVENFSYISQFFGSIPNLISREDMVSFKTVWAEFSNAKTGYLDRRNFAAFFSRLRGAFEVRVYPPEYAIPQILAICRQAEAWFTSSAREQIVDGVDLTQLSRILDNVDYADIQKRKATYNRLYHEASSLYGLGISFTDTLVLLAHHKLIIDSEALISKDLIARSEINRHVSDCVDLDRVRSVIKTIVCRRRYRSFSEIGLERRAKADARSIVLDSMPEGPSMSSTPLLETLSYFKTIPAGQVYTSAKGKEKAKAPVSTLRSAGKAKNTRLDLDDLPSYADVEG